MSIINQAKEELRRINFGDEDSAVMIDLLERFLEQWDSGGAVHAVAPVFQRLIAGKPLSPLTGADDEWFDHGGGVFQNIRAGSVFKDPRFHDGKLAYDLDNPAGPREAITFPYWTDRAEVASPVIEAQRRFLCEIAAGQAPVKTELVGFASEMAAQLTARGLVTRYFLGFDQWSFQLTDAGRAALSANGASPERGPIQALEAIKPLINQ